MNLDMFTRGDNAGSQPTARVAGAHAGAISSRTPLPRVIAGDDM